MTAESRFACVLTLSFLVVFLLVQDTLAFSSVLLSRTSARRSTTTIPCMSVLDDLNLGDASPEQPFINPLKTKKGIGNSAYTYSGATVSLRTTTMNQMINELLRVAGNAVECETILQDYKNFLLEPLDDLDAVLDSDSVYTSQMSRAERYRTYRNFMDGRLLNSTKPQVKAVLTSMRDFVLRHEPKE